MDDATTAPFENIRLTVDPDSHVATLVLSRPAVLNAMTGAMRTEILAALESVATSDARCLVVRGDGPGFSSGADLGAYLSEVDVTDEDSVRAFIRAWNDAVLAIRDLPIPSVAAVHGVAYGGGLNLALACDLVVVGRSARLCQSYLNIGATADMGASWLLPRLVGLARARELVLLGEEVGAERAVQIGLAVRAVEDADLVATAEDLATRLASRDAHAVAANRRLLDTSIELGLRDAMEAEAEAIVSTVMAPPFQAAAARFVRPDRAP